MTITLFLLSVALIVGFLVVLTIRAKRKTARVAAETVATTGTGKTLVVSWEKPGSGIWIWVSIILILTIAFVVMKYYQNRTPQELYGQEITLDAGEISPPFRLDVGFRYSYATNRKVKVFNVRYPHLSFYAYPGFIPEHNTAYNGEYRILALDDCKVTVLRSLATAH
jgi:hypothetical protein